VKWSGVLLREAKDNASPGEDTGDARTPQGGSVAQARRSAKADRYRTFTGAGPLHPTATGRPQA
jgi:hypothetical protein